MQSIFKWRKSSLNSDFLLPKRRSWLENRWIHFFCKELVQSEKQTASSRIWTWITDFIFYDNDCYAQCVSILVMYHLMLYSKPGTENTDLKLTNNCAFIHEVAKPCFSYFICRWSTLLLTLEFSFIFSLSCQLRLQNITFQQRFTWYIPRSVPSMTLNCIWWWGFSPGDKGM